MSIFYFLQNNTKYALKNAMMFIKILHNFQITILGIKLNNENLTLIGTF